VAESGGSKVREFMTFLPPGLSRVPQNLFGSVGGKGLGRARGAQTSRDKLLPGTDPEEEIRRGGKDHPASKRDQSIVEGNPHLIRNPPVSGTTGVPSDFKLFGERGGAWLFVGDLACQEVLTTRRSTWNGA